MIVKYTSVFAIHGDLLKVENEKINRNRGFLVNYGMCKPKEERIITYERRKKAWSEGMNRGYGTHYKDADNNQWIWNKTKLVDIRTSKEWEIIKKNHGY